MFDCEDFPIGEFLFDTGYDMVAIFAKPLKSHPTLNRNSGKGYFVDVGAVSGLGVASRSVKWGVGFADFDLDSWPDIFLASGHLIAGISRVNDSEKFASPNYSLSKANAHRESCGENQRIPQEIPYFTIQCKNTLDWPKGPLWINLMFLGGYIELIDAIPLGFDQVGIGEKALDA